MDFYDGNRDFVHESVFCDFCMTQIHGTWYRCVYCFADLCGYHQRVHDMNHVFLEIKARVRHPHGLISTVNCSLESKRGLCEQVSLSIAKYAVSSESAIPLCHNLMLCLPLELYGTLTNRSRMFLFFILSTKSRMIPRRKLEPYQWIPDVQRHTIDLCLAKQ